MADINLSSFQKHVQNFMNIVKSSGDAKVDEQTFAEKVTNDISIFKMLDQNHDGKISEDEINTVLQADSDDDGIVTEKEFACMEQMKFSAKREIDKWFSFDINRDGHISNVEDILAEKRLFSDTELEGAKTNEQLAKLYNLQEKIEDKNLILEGWLNNSIEELKQEAKEKYGIELSNNQIIILKNEQKKHLNTWLFKTGDNATSDAPLYNSLNNTAYTRLVTMQQTVSCCGGDIIPPPVTNDRNSCTFVFSDLSLENSLNSSEEVKNRLAWAMYPMSPELKEIKTQIDKEFQTKIDAGELTPEEAEEQKKEVSVWERVSDEDYHIHHEHYQQMRDMKASDFRELLKLENEQKRIEFEKHSSMTVKQIVDYIDIVEQQIGIGNFDNDNWSVNSTQYQQIVYGINGTVSDEDKLHGKTRVDIPENRQNLLRFLEERGWLKEQFKI